MRSSGGVLRMQIWYLGKLEPPCPWRMPTGWDGWHGQGLGCQWSRTPSIEESWGHRNRGTLSYCATALIPPTYQHITMDVAQNFIPATLLTKRREASSWCITTSYVMGWTTLQSRTSNPHTCMTNPKYIQVAPCVEGRTSSKVSLQWTKESWRSIY